MPTDKPEPVRRSKEEQRLLDIADGVEGGGDSAMLAEVLRAFSAREDEDNSSSTIAPLGTRPTVR